MKMLTIENEWTSYKEKLPPMDESTEKMVKTSFYCGALARHCIGVCAGTHYDGKILEQIFKNITKEFNAFFESCK